MNRQSLVNLAVLAALVSSPAWAQRPESPEMRMSVQRDAMAKLAYLDGVWRGPAVTTAPDGSKHEIVQTERIGPFLGGSIKVLEGRGYEANGTVSFNALGTISYDAAKKTYTLHSNAQGYVGDYVLTATESGFTWEIPAGPMIMRYTATIKDGHWNEVGDRIFPGKAPVRFFEMNLKRIGDTSWPAGGAVSPR